MSNEQPETPQPSPAAPSTEPSRAQLEGLLGEAKNTRDVLVGFEHAVKRGTFEGDDAIDLAKGLAFLEAIIKQNEAHITNIEKRLKEVKE